MYKNGKYRETDKMSDLICENYPMVLVMSRFGIALGFGEKNIGEVCRQNGVDPCTFLTVVNFLTEEISAPMTNIDKCLSIEALITYLHNAHAYFLDFRLPHIRRKLTDAIADCPKDVAFVITKFFDEYAAEVHKHMSYEEKTVFPYVRGLLKGIKDPKYNITIFRKHHDQIEMKMVRLRTLGCWPLTGAVESGAATIEEIVEEMMTTTKSERTTRVIDFDQEGSMEQKKREGYF